MDVPENLFDLSGKVALITGANSGLGFGFARGLARAGSDVILWGRRADRNEEAAAALRAHGVRVFADVVDVASEPAIVAGFARALDAMGRVDTMVANAGIASRVPFTEMDVATYRKLIDVNLDGAVFTLREGARHMKARAEAGDPGGSLIICGSGSIFQGVPTMAHYGIAKGALNALAKALAAELGPIGVRCNVIAPGFIETEMTFADPEVGKMIADLVAAKAPLGRAGKPADLEGAVVYLASDMSAYHTGDTLVVDGGKMSAN
ncbi:SDR family oxidoreductase (plasmid) [Sphingobium sp. SJ10-10]|uniref:SDR family NAD(P)-dependent oxidoreductase n=1 Tax=unclassified Sphingobium TaxID=2611147 RepID=UPI000C9ED092|nr:MULTISPECIES: SDR family oxidoreductase [unclassified Sphingobium]MCB4858889.1 SDR family oxidoreductase [Sphingobium sp. PNB]MEC6700740.1 SDR family oxidoreductase [Sphingobium sp. SJ10-10]